MLFVMGLYPKPFLGRMEPSVQAYLSRIHSKMATSAPIEQQAERLTPQTRTDG
jgi:hypothetical protein